MHLPIRVSVCLTVARMCSGGARTVYSEDLNHGQQYGRVRIVNPFAR
jgi:predicted nucleic acid-binding protein